jgi:hypothetical protein
VTNETNISEKAEMEISSKDLREKRGEKFKLDANG